MARIIGELPEVAEGERYGHPTWSIRGRGFAWLRPFSKADLKRFGDQTPPAPPILAVNTADLHEKEGVLAAGIDGVFTIEHFNNYPAVLIELSVIAPGGAPRARSLFGELTRAKAKPPARPRRVRHS